MGVRFLFLVFLLVGCGARDSTPKTPRGPVYQLEPIGLRTQPDRDGGKAIEAFDAKALNDEGNQYLTRKNYTKALQTYRQLMRLFPESNWVSPARYNSGLALEGLSRIDEAISSYQQLIKEFPQSRDAIDASFRIAALQAEYGRFASARATLERIARLGGLTSDDHVERWARLGYVLLRLSDLVGSETACRKAIRLYYSSPGLTKVKFVAMARYYLGRVFHERFLALQIRPEDLLQDLAAKRQALNQAYDLYLEAVQMHDHWWSVASGYQMSEIYWDLWKAVEAAPVPLTLREDAWELYEKELQEKAQVIQKTAVEGHLANVQFAARMGADNAWKQASEKRAIFIRRQMKK